MGLIAALIVAACGGNAEGPTHTPRPAAATATAIAKPTTPPTVPATLPPLPTATPSPTTLFMQRLTGDGIGGTRYYTNPPNPLLTPRVGGSATISNNGYPPSLNTLKSGSVNTLMGMHPLHNRLIRCAYGLEMKSYHPWTCELTGDLAESWSVGADGKSYDFKLRPRVKFQNVAPVNGREVNADDVVFSFESFKKEAAYFGNRNWQSMASAQVVDPRTVRVTATNGNVDFLVGTVAFHTSVVLAKDNPNQENPIGTGPYLISDMKKEIEWSLKRNPDYWRRDARGTQLPYIDSIRIISIPDFTAGIAAFRTGQTLYGQGATSHLAGQKDLRKSIMETFPNARLASVPGTGNDYIAMRLDSPLGRDINVRRAISMSVHRETILQVTAEGLWYLGGTGQVGPPIPFVWAFDQPLKMEEAGPWYQYNPTGAKRLLTLAGYPEGITIIWHYPPQLRQNIGPQAEIWKESAKEVGITIELRPLDTATWMQMASTYQMKKGTPETIIWNSATSRFTADGDTYSALYSHYSPELANDPELDKLLEQQRVETDPAKRRQILRQIYQADAGKLYRIGLGSMGNFCIYREQLNGEIYNVRNQWPFWGAQQWESMWLS
ncbi:MAG: ABC transporter substrate-binding protein [Chloroflexi bacterium]|nr:ABC transporter substrate-binding protein [Chloroflexota bacterium]